MLDQLHKMVRYFHVAVVLIHDLQVGHKSGCLSVEVLGKEAPMVFAVGEAEKKRHVELREKRRGSSVGLEYKTALQQVGMDRLHSYMVAGRVGHNVRHLGT